MSRKWTQKIVIFTLTLARYRLLVSQVILRDVTHKLFVRFKGVNQTPFVLCKISEYRFS